MLHAVAVCLQLREFEAPMQRMAAHFANAREGHIKRGAAVHGGWS